MFEHPGLAIAAAIAGFLGAVACVYWVLSAIRSAGQPRSTQEASPAADLPASARSPAARLLRRVAGHVVYLYAFALCLSLLLLGVLHFADSAPQLGLLNLLVAVPLALRIWLVVTSSRHTPNPQLGLEIGLMVLIPILVSAAGCGCMWTYLMHGVEPSAAAW
jgi:hypothetical protein